MNKKEIKKALSKSNYIDHYPIKFKVFRSDNTEIINSNIINNHAYISFKFRSDKKYIESEIMNEFRRIVKDCTNINIKFYEEQGNYKNYFAYIYFKDMEEIDHNPKKEIYSSRQKAVSKVSKSAYIYILKLENNKYYVGTTTDYERRFKQHVEGRGHGSKWTEKYKPINITNVYELKNMSIKKSFPFEDYIAEEMILKYGYENVRGGKFTQSVEINKALIEKQSYIKKRNSINISLLIKLI